MKNINSNIAESKLNHDDNHSENCNVYLEELVKIYQSEKKLNQKLPLMIKKAPTQEIVKSLTTHLKFTQEHLLRLEALFNSINDPLINKLKTKI
jgi:ferritin-like metal-binding protein YciE